MKTEAIERFLREQYSDEKLAALLAHAEDGKLSYFSCCCFIGVATADHALHVSFAEQPHAPRNQPHFVAAKALPGACDAEWEFNKLDAYELHGRNGDPDQRRRAAIIPIIRAEIARRDALREDAESARVLGERDHAQSGSGPDSSDARAELLRVGAGA